MLSLCSWSLPGLHVNTARIVRWLESDNVRYGSFRFPPTCVFFRFFRHCQNKQASSRIIGRGGAFIKQLQRESGSKINTLKDIDLRSGLKARVMNVCGNRTAMSKGLYLIARKISSRWEYDSEWEGGDPTVPLGQGLPSANQSRGGGGSGGGGSGGGNADAGDMDVDGSHGQYRRSRGGRRNNSRGGERDGRGGGRRDSDNDMGSGGGGGGGGGGRDGYDRGGGSYDAAAAARAPAPGSGSMGSQWAESQILASVVGAQAAAAAAAAGTPSAVSAESWARLLGQIPPAARESLGIGSAQLAAAAVAGGAPASDVFGRPVQQQQPLQQQQVPQQVHMIC